MESVIVSALANYKGASGVAVIEEDTPFCYEIQESWVGRLERSKQLGMIDIWGTELDRKMAMTGVTMILL
ncbi:hypothetical protein VTL71DRAFT_6542 [Oculimacula yallundae]|uniref:Uncharacterized protein n=1 Tax=Oculimacula yallundae TaxID=86028 RepID=A0ABR4BX96_9HELO